MTSIDFKTKPLKERDATMNKPIHYGVEELDPGTFCGVDELDPGTFH